MTIALRAAGAWAAGSTAPAPVIPTGTTTGDIMVLYVGCKPFSATINTPSGWTLITGTDGQNGTTASGIDTGSVRWAAFYRAWLSGDANPTISVTSGNVSLAVIHSYSKTLAAWVTPTGAKGSDTTSGTGFSLTMDANPGITLNDMLATFATIAGNNATFGTPTLTAAGATIGTVTEQPATEGSTATGNDLESSASQALCTAGTATAAPVVGWTLSVAQTGGGAIVRLREVDTQTFPQTLTATTVTSAATRQLQANKPMTATIVTSIATATKQANKTLTATLVSAAATMTQGLAFARTLTASLVSHVATMTRGLTFGRTLTATAVTSTATRQLQANKPLTASIVTSAATRQLQTNKSLAASMVTSTATATKEARKTLTASLVSTAATISRGLMIARTLTASLVSHTASMSRGLAFGRTLSALSTVVAKLTRHRSHGLPFLYTAANWGSVSFYLEVFLQALSGTALARLYNQTDGVAVTNSELSTTSGSFVRLRSSALTLVDGKVYNVQFGSEDSNSGAFRGAKIVVV